MSMCGPLAPAPAELLGWVGGMRWWDALVGWVGGMRCWDVLLGCLHVLCTLQMGIKRVQASSALHVRTLCIADSGKVCVFVCAECALAVCTADGRETGACMYHVHVLHAADGHKASACVSRCCALQMEALERKTGLLLGQPVAPKKKGKVRCVLCVCV